MNFFVVGIGRSGTTWLARLLDQSPSHRCLHEEADPRCKNVAQPYSPFPLDRFLSAGPNYGECHGMLRYHLSAGVPNGKEKMIPRRVWLRRNLLAVIASWMNGWDRSRDELSAVCYEVLWQYRNLQQWETMDKGARLVRMEYLTTDLPALQEFTGWLEIDLEVTPEMQAPVNAQPASVKWFTWTSGELEILRTIASRLQIDGIEGEIAQHLDSSQQ